MNRKYMNKKVFFIVLAAVLIIAVPIGIFWYYHPTHYKYNDRFIIGSTKETIIQEYGEFYREVYNKNNEIVRGEYLVREDTKDMVMGYDDSIWFIITFENGVAIDTDIREGNIGG